MSFRQKDPFSGPAWQPARVSGDSTAAACANEAIGIMYACDLIDHLRMYGEHIISHGNLVCDVVEEIVKSGKFGDVERSFLRALGSYIATGRITQLCVGFDVVPWRGGPQS